MQCSAAQSSVYKDRQFEIDQIIDQLSNNMKLVHWPLMDGVLHLVQPGDDSAGPQPAQALLAVPNVTAHPSTASVPITFTVLLYNDWDVRWCAVLMWELQVKLNKS